MGGGLKQQTRILWCGLVGFLTGVAPAGAQAVWTQSVLALLPQEAKAVALGGALTSVHGDLDVLLYNPAALETYRYPQRFRFSPVLNPTVLAVYGADRGGRPIWRETDLSERAALIGTVFPGLLLRWKAVDFAVNLGIDLGSSEFEEKPALRFDGFPVSHGHLAAARIRLAKEVTVGASVFYAQRRDGQTVRRDVGASYGVLLQSREGLRFGVAYVALPAPARETLRYRDRLASGTVNLGLSYTAFRRWLVSLDVRNLSEETKHPVREFHVGTQLVVYRHFAFRGGAYRDNDRNETVWSGGLALFDRNRFVSPDRFLRRRSFVVEYGVRVFPTERQAVHAFSLLLRL